MRGTGDEEPGPSGLGGPEGGYAARRKKLREKEEDSSGKKVWPGYTFQVYLLI